MAFKLNGSLDPHGAPLLRRVTLANSTEYTELDAVKVDTDGFLAPATAGDAIFGHIKGISRNTGSGVLTDGSAGADVGSFEDTFTTASDNETVDQVKGEVDISQFTLYSAESNNSPGNTSGSDEIGVYLDLADEDTIDETTVTDSTAQYHSFGVDPNDSSRLIVNVFESSVFTSA